MKNNLMEQYKEWRLASEEMLEDGFTGSLDCGEQKVREDFSRFAELSEVISFEKMLELEKSFENELMKLNEKLTQVEVWDGNNLNDWQVYDCPDNNDTVKEYAEWCVGADSDFWPTVNSATDKIRLNGWYIIDGADYYDN